MTRKLFSIPAYGADGREFSLICVMGDAQIIEMSHIGKFVIRADFASEVLAIGDADATTVAAAEAEWHKLEGGLQQ